MIVCNQDFLTAHLIRRKRRQEGLISSLVDVVVVDEAHNLENKVRSALTELLPGGTGTVDDVAMKLGFSKRTLQRKLTEENTSFQKQLNGTREILAKHYIRNTDMSSDEIAFLLGYQEINSFLRAFHLWTGMSVSDFRTLP